MKRKKGRKKSSGSDAGSVDSKGSKTSSGGYSDIGQSVSGVGSSNDSRASSSAIKYQYGSKWLIRSKIIDRYLYDGTPAASTCDQHRRQTSISPSISGGAGALETLETWRRECSI